MEPAPNCTMRSTQIVYYLSREGQLEQPHLLEVPYSSPDGFRLRDVKKRLSTIRGETMPTSYCWSYKRTYKNGFVWQDLFDDDLIFPPNEQQDECVVLKGSRLLGINSTDTGWILPVIENPVVTSIHMDRGKQLPNLCDDALLSNSSPMVKVQVPDHTTTNMPNSVKDDECSGSLTISESQKSDIILAIMDQICSIHQSPATTSEGSTIDIAASHDTEKVVDDDAASSTNDRSSTRLEEIPQFRAENRSLLCHIEECKETTDECCDGMADALAEGLMQEKEPKNEATITLLHPAQKTGDYPHPEDKGAPVTGDEDHQSEEKGVSMQVWSTARVRKAQDLPIQFVNSSMRATGKGDRQQDAAATLYEEPYAGAQRPPSVAGGRGSRNAGRTDRRSVSERSSVPSSPSARRGWGYLSCRREGDVVAVAQTGEIRASSTPQVQMQIQGGSSTHHRNRSTLEASQRQRQAFHTARDRAAKPSTRESSTGVECGCAAKVPTNAAAPTICGGSGAGMRSRQGSEIAARSESLDHTMQGRRRVGYSDQLGVALPDTFMSSDFLPQVDETGGEPRLQQQVVIMRRGYGIRNQDHQWPRTRSSSTRAMESPVFRSDRHETILARRSLSDLPSPESTHGHSSLALWDELLESTHKMLHSGQKTHA